MRTQKYSASPKIYVIHIQKDRYNKCGYIKCYFSPKIIITPTKNKYIFTKITVQE